MYGAAQRACYVCRVMCACCCFVLEVRLISEFVLIAKRCFAGCFGWAMKLVYSGRKMARSYWTPFSSFRFRKWTLNLHYSLSSCFIRRNSHWLCQRHPQLFDIDAIDKKALIWIQLKIKQVVSRWLAFDVPYGIRLALLMFDINKCAYRRMRMFGSISSLNIATPWIDGAARELWVRLLDAYYGKYCGIFGASCYSFYFAVWLVKNQGKLSTSWRRRKGKFKLNIFPDIFSLFSRSFALYELTILKTQEHSMPQIV